MNATQQDLVRTTFAKLALMPEVAGALFYERLFAMNPNFRPLFKHDMRIQGAKLMTMLAMVVYNLHEPGLAAEFRPTEVRRPKVRTGQVQGPPPRGSPC